MTQLPESRRYRPTVTRPYAVEFHIEGCACADCTRAIDLISPALTIARLTIAGILVGNAVAFAIDPAGSWATLTGALAHLVGAR